jgi:hypothetical protein
VFDLVPWSSSEPSPSRGGLLVFGLAASVLLLAPRHGPPASRVLAVAGLSAGAVLLVGRDLHGAAVALGAIVAATLLRSRTRVERTAS